MSTTEQTGTARRWLGRRRSGAVAAAAELHEVGPHFVIAPGTAGGSGPAGLPAALTDALAALAPVVGTVTVLAAAADAQPVLLERLDDLARTAARRKAATLVLAASGLAAAPGGGDSAGGGGSAGGGAGRRPAQRIAELAATSIVAPDGVVTLRPDGTLLTSGATDAEPSSWWLCTPDGRTRRLGALWPLPGTGAAQSRAGGTAGAAAGASAPAAAEAGPAPEEGAVPTEGAAPKAPDPASAAAPAGPGSGAVRAVAGVPTVPAAAPAPAGAPVAPLGATAPPDGPAEPAEPVEPVEPAAPAAPTGPAAPDSPAEPPTTALPHGRWLHGAPAPAVPPPALLLAASAPGTPVLVVGRPGAPLPPAAEVAHAAARLGAPGAGPAELLISAPWAATPALVALAGELAAGLGREVRAAVGLPTHTAHGCSSRILTADGTQTWEPWLTELTACPDLGRVIASAWRPLPAGFAPCGPALHQAPVAGWRLEAVPAGVWLRPERTPLDRGPRLLDPDPDRPTLIAGSADRTPPAEVLDLLDDLLSALTDPGTPAPRLLLPAAPAGPRPAPPAAAATPEAVAPASTTPTAVPPTALPPTALPPAAVAPAGAPPAAEAPTTEAPTAAPPASTAGDGGTPATPEAPDSPRPDVPEAPDSPVPQAVPAAPTPPAAPAPPRLLVPSATAPAAAGRVSTAAERAAFRALLGERFHRYASRAEQAALRMPALRAQDREELKDDLTAVYLHHTDTGIPVHRAELVEAARRGPGAGALAPYLACLGSGLRRLPNHRGAVLLGAEAGEEALRQYVPGALLVEPAPVVGTAEAEVVPGTCAEFLVWSATGRRTAAIAEDGDPEVVFPPGTRFTVLDVLPAGEDRPARVLLREAGPASAPDAAGEEQDRARLLAWQERRDRLAPERRRAPARPERLRLAPGVAL
ncbi:hypothetical protein AB0O91_27885 [Kitasatospora sp. NPDC089797]|uniref:hypothetical protein n=1 Tax=Kitasatospora sp. NPDC089797 TaxID=3155298 RepID=UPI0034283778